MMNRRLATLSLIAPWIAAAGCATRPTTPSAATKPIDAAVRPAAVEADSRKFSRLTDQRQLLEPQAEPLAANLSALAGAKFNGAKRKNAKTELVHVAPQRIALSELLRQLETSDSVMRSRGIGVAPTSPRQPEEQRNVTIHGWIYAMAEEGDHDFHLVIGTTAIRQQARFINCEASALRQPGPDDASFVQVRQKIIDALGDQTPTSSSWKRPVPPIGVTITGSLFYDVGHGEVIGPADSRPQTDWEIHPIADIKFD